MWINIRNDIRKSSPEQEPVLLLYSYTAEYVKWTCLHELGSVRCQFLGYQDGFSWTARNIEPDQPEQMCRLQWFSLCWCQSLSLINTSSRGIKRCNITTYLTDRNLVSPTRRPRLCCINSAASLSLSIGPWTIRRYWVTLSAIPTLIM